jgi:hypothetical protein
LRGASALVNVRAPARAIGPGFLLGDARPIAPRPLAKKAKSMQHLLIDDIKRKGVDQ